MTVNLEDSINIKDLVLERPGRKVEPISWDVEVNITEDDWRGMIFELDRVATEVSYPGPFLEHARAMKTISPKKFAEIDLNRIIPDSLSYYRPKLITSNSRGDIQWDTSITRIFNFKLLFPERFDEVRPADHLWSGIFNFASLIQNLDVNQANFLLGMRGLFPEKELRKSFLEMLGSIVKLEKTTRTDALVQVAAATRLIYPIESDAAGLSVDTYLANYSLEQFKAVGNWSMVAKVAAGLTVLSAQTARLTDDGIKLTFKDSVQPTLDQNLQPQPERRKF